MKIKGFNGANSESLFLFYEEKGEDDEAVEWLRKAREETEPILDSGCI